METGEPGEVDGRQKCRVGLAVLKLRRLLIAHRERAEESVRQQTGDLAARQCQRLRTDVSAVRTGLTQ